jgi:hypothetical protein
VSSHHFTLSNKYLSLNPELHAPKTNSEYGNSAWNEIKRKTKRVIGNRNGKKDKKI